MSDIYKIAAQEGLRFPSNKGLLTVEQLFALPLKSKTGFDLDTVACGIDRSLEGTSRKSFVEDTADDPQRRQLTVALEIVKDVISTKQAENRAAVLRANKAAERRKLLDAIAAKKDQALTAASLEELERQLTALDT